MSMRKLGPDHSIVIPKKFTVEGPYLNHYKQFLVALAAEAGGYTILEGKGGWRKADGTIQEEAVEIVSARPTEFDYTAYGRTNGIIYKFADWLIDQGETEVMVASREGTFMRRHADRLPQARGIRN